MGHGRTEANSSTHPLIHFHQLIGPSDRGERVTTSPHAGQGGQRPTHPLIHSSTFMHSSAHRVVARGSPHRHMAPKGQVSRAWKVRMCMRMHASRPCASRARTESLAAALLAGAAPLLAEAPCRPERYALVRRAYTAVGAGEPTQRAPPSRRGRWDHGARARVNV